MKKDIPALTQPLKHGDSDPAGELETRDSTAIPNDSTRAAATDGGARTASDSTVADTRDVAEALADEPKAELSDSAFASSSGAASPPVEPPAAAASGGSGNGLPLALSGIALVVAAVCGWQIFEQRVAGKELRDEVAMRLSQADVTVGELRGLSRQQQEMIVAVQGRLGALDAQIAATEGQAAALEALYQEYSRSRGDQVLAEVEQAINIAAQQLQLAGNYEAALIALEGADARLAQPDQGHLQALRRALIKDLDTIKAHPRVDVSGLALRLEILLERVDSLPLAYEFTLDESAALGEKTATAPVDPMLGTLEQGLGYAKAVASDVWSEIKGMVRLERLDHSDPVLLAPAQSTYLRENVKIRLLTARLALLARDGRTYAEDLAQARSWMERFFDLREDSVQRALADLDELGKLQISAQAPTLDNTFAALRLVQARGTSASRAPAAPATATQP